MMTTRFVDMVLFRLRAAFEEWVRRGRQRVATADGT
jgi:hypothetical protein